MQIKEPLSLSLSLSLSRLTSRKNPRNSTTYNLLPTNYHPAFTIVELLVVIVVIGVLASIALVSYTGISKKATMATITSDLDNAYKKFKLYQVENSGYPNPSDIELGCTTPSIPTKICLKPSPNNQYTLVTLDNSVASNQIFCLEILNVSINTKYHISSDGSQGEGICPTYSLNLIAGTGGSVNTSANGAYVPGTSVTITATSDGVHIFSSWTGAGCSGAFSHAVIMDIDKTCTANFAIDTVNWLSVGTQIWAKANMNVGTMIAGATAQTNSSSLEKYCYNDTESNCTANGALYQWDEAMQYVTNEGARGICPTGSHIPTIAEWHTLINYFGGDSVASTNLKSGGSSGLNMPLAGLYVGGGLGFMFGSSRTILYASSMSGANVWGLDMYSSNATAYWNSFGRGGNASVRCLGN